VRLGRLLEIVTVRPSSSQGDRLDAGRHFGGGPMSPTLAIVLLWVAFAATHMLMSSIRFRPKLVSLLTDRGFQGVYSLIAFGIFGPLCVIYFDNKHAGPLLYSIPVSTGVWWLLSIGMAIAFVLLFCGLLTPSPTSLSAGEETAEPRGVHYITRHALLMSMALFGLLHLIPNGYASDVAFFGGFPVFVLMGTAHQDRRKLALDGDRYRPFYEATPWIPFTGGSTLRGLREISLLAVGLGVAATVVLRYFHAALFSG